MPALRVVIGTLLHRSSFAKIDAHWRAALHHIVAYCRLPTPAAVTALAPARAACEICVRDKLAARFARLSLGALPGASGYFPPERLFMRRL